MSNAVYTYNLGIRFYDTCKQQGSKIALQYPNGETFSYDEVNRLSNQMGRMLLVNGISKGDVVAIFNEKSPYGYALMLGCLKIGAIYTNLDVTSPEARIHKIIATCNPRLVFFGLVDDSVKDLFNVLSQSIKVIDLHGENIHRLIESFNDNNLDESLSVQGENPAYIMFTSGSTGFPKGAVMTHSNVLNFIQWGKQTFNVSPEDIFTNANPIYFDNSVFDFYVSIFNGATLVPLSHELVKNATDLVKAINASHCTIWFSVPSLLVYLLTTKALGSSDFKSITRISFGGEGFPKNKLKQLYDLFGDRITLYNVYGPTECTCICSSYIINKGDFDNMNELAPLGFLAPNFDYEILSLKDDSSSGFGELALIGPCVGLGYYNDVERTEKSFIQNPKVLFAQRMYKTGDVVERTKDGRLHFRGRVDNQIKHMGYRIELEEVEAAFSSLPYVNEVGVIYEKINADLGQIKAYVSLADERDTKTILNEVKRLLPAYMVPRILKILQALPKNANGKIDRKQLAEL